MALEVATSIPATRVIHVLEELIALHGPPLAIRVDNGPELLAQVFVEWCAARGIAGRSSMGDTSSAVRARAFLR